MWCLQCRGPGTGVPSPRWVSCGRDATRGWCPGLPATAGSLELCPHPEITDPGNLVWRIVLVMPRPRAVVFRPACPSRACAARGDGGEVSAVVSWGVTAAGAKRYRCTWCGRSFSPLGGSREARTLLRKLRKVGHVDAAPADLRSALFRAERVRRLRLRKGSAADVSAVVRGALAQEPMAAVARSIGVDRSTARNWLRNIALDRAGRAALDFWILEALGRPPPRAWAARMVELMRKLGASY